MIYSVEQCCSLIEKKLEELSVAQKEPVGLYEPIDYVMACGGKRVRPVLALLACNLFDDRPERALMPAVALEVFHNFTLLHDDLMDNADVRRNRPTVHKRWSDSTAILSGDAMMILAYRYLFQAESTDLTELSDIFTRTALEVCEGQQYDMDFEQRTDVSIGEYMQMIRLKTAVLLAGSLKMGAVCGGADSRNAEALYRFGISVGLTFQIQDDWLDVYSDPKTFGKAVGGDILCGKKTYLLLTAFEKADAETRQLLDMLLKDKKMSDAEKINRVKAVYDRLDVSNVARQATEKHYAEAMVHLREVQLPDASRKSELEKFASQLLKRDK